MGKGISKGNKKDSLGSGFDHYNSDEDNYETGNERKSPPTPIHTTKSQFSSNFDDLTLKFRVFDGKGVEEMENYGVIPLSVIHRVFLFLEVENLVSVFLSCRLFYAASNTALFWKEYYENCFKDDILSNKSFRYNETNWKKKFYKRASNVSDRMYRKKYFITGSENDNLEDRKIGGIYPFRSVMLGGDSVGKSNFCLRYVKGCFRVTHFRVMHNEYNDYMESTIGAAFHTQKFCYESKGKERIDLVMEIWDTAGQERYKSLAPMYFRGSKLQFVMYDISNSQSFATAKEWVKTLKKYSPYLSVNIVLIGNKSDLVLFNGKNRGVSKTEAAKYAKEEKIPFCEISTKENKNIFQAIGLGLDGFIRLLK